MIVGALLIVLALLGAPLFAVIATSAGPCWGTVRRGLAASGPRVAGTGGASGRSVRMKTTPQSGPAGLRRTVTGRPVLMPMP